MFGGCGLSDIWRFMAGKKITKQKPSILNWNFHLRAVSILLLTWGVFFGFIFSRAIEVDQTGVYAGHVNVWSDWALHISMVNIFAYKNVSEWFAYHPIYSGGKFTYGFLTNLISGMLMRMGLNLPQAMILPSIIYVMLMLAAMYGLFWLLSRSRLKAVLAVNFFLLSSGPGFWRFLAANGYRFNLEGFVKPLVDYSALGDYSWLAGNIIVGMLLPQRAFLLGLTLALWSLTLLSWEGIRKKPGCY
jgi:hypothetical protein